MHSICCVSTSIGILHKTQRLKLLSIRNAKFLHNAEITKPLICTSRIICTDTRHKNSVRHQLQPITEQNCPVSLLIAKHHSNLHLIPFPDQYESIIKIEEFSKKVQLPRSVFLYDVDVENSKNPRPFSGVYYYSFEDVYNSSLYHVKGRQIEEVLMATDSKENNTGRPTEEQLLVIIDRLTNCLIGFFEKPHDYSIYNKNIVFQNNIKGVTIKGLTAYMQAMYLLRIYGFVQYAKVKVVILKITHHLDDGSVRVRWRVTGVSRPKVLLNLWKLKSMSWQQFVQTEEEWLDGFSVFKVGTDGLIYKHICDKMIPKDETETAKKVDFKSRLLGLFELGPRGPAAGSLNTLIPCYRHQEYSSPSKKLT